MDELAKFFDEVILSSNHRILKNIPTLAKNVSIQFHKNKGYDFGRFYTIYRSIESEKYYRIACVNDSNILINSLTNVLNFEDIDHFDFWGLLDSYEKPWFVASTDNYHIQSHFLIFNQKAIDALPEYFQSVDMNEFFNEKNNKILRQKVIIHWEIGLSQFMRSMGLNIGHFIDTREITNNYKMHEDINISHKLYEELLINGYPLIKKKAILDQKNQTGKKVEYWNHLIAKYGNITWNLNRIIEELKQFKNEVREIKHPGLIDKIILHLQRNFVKKDTFPK